MAGADGGSTPTSPILDADATHQPHQTEVNAKWRREGTGAARFRKNGKGLALLSLLLAERRDFRAVSCSAAKNGSIGLKVPRAGIASAIRLDTACGWDPRFSAF